MLRIIAVVILGVLAVVQSGCDKIKTELERRHLGAEEHKETLPKTYQEIKAFNVKRNGVKETSERKQIVIRIDLPTDEKIQIRLIKNAALEEMSKDVCAAPPKETLKTVETPPEAEEALRSKPDNPAESVKEKSAKELNDQKDDESKSEIKTETDKESRSEMKTDGDDVSTPPPLLAPTVVVPAEGMNSPPVLPDMPIKNSLASSKLSEPSPAEKAVGLALSVTPPEMNASPSNKAQNAASSTDKPTPSSPWSIPNAEYPLRYY